MNCLFGYRDSKDGISFLSHAVYKNCLIGACFDNDDNDTPCGDKCLNLA